jgi:hypothetical protein
LRGGPLEAHDKFSFDHSPPNSAADWEIMLHRYGEDAEIFATLVEQLPEARLWHPFAGDKYGNYYRNLLGLIEHTHYHLGQIVLIKKILSNNRED